MNSWKKIALVAVVIFVILYSRFFPVYYAITKTPTGYTYSGQITLYDPDDINAYVSAIYYGQDGNILLKNLYMTSDKNNETFIYPVYTISGYLFRNIDPYILFHILAAISTVIVCLGIFLLSYKILADFKYALLSMFLVTRGGGFGWFMPDFLHGADLFWSGITFATTLQRPHEGIGILLYIITAVSYFYYLKEKKKWLSTVAAITGFLLIPLYPYYLFNSFLILGLYSALFAIFYKKFEILKNFILTAGIFGILALIYRFIIQQSGFAFTIDESIPPVGIVSLLTGYGTFILLFLAGKFVKLKRKMLPEARFFTIWIVISIALSYLPLGYSRIFLKGLFFPLTLQALVIIKNIEIKKYRIIFLIVFSMILPLTTIATFTYRLKEADRRSNYVYIRNEVSHMFDALKDKKRDGVLAFYRLGNFIPAKTGKSVFLGHIGQTPEINIKGEEMYKFYEGKMTDSQAKQFLTDNNLNFVVYGREEKYIGGHIYPFLRLRFSENDVQLYSL